MAPERYRRSLTTLVVVVAIVFGFNIVWRACDADAERSDFVYLAAARAVLDGTNIYESRSARGRHDACPPPFATVMVPFTAVPKPVAALLLRWGSLGVRVVLVLTTAPARRQELA